MIDRRGQRVVPAGDQFDRLLAGGLGLQNLDVPLADFYHLGFFDGRASLASALVNAESAADRYYRRAFDRQSDM